MDKLLSAMYLISSIAGFVDIQSCVWEKTIRKQNKKIKIKNRNLLAYRNQNFIPGLLTGYQNYVVVSGSTWKGGCGFYSKKKKSFAVRQVLSKKHLSSQNEWGTVYWNDAHQGKLGS